MASNVIEYDIGTSGDNNISKVVQLSNLEAFIKRTLGGTGEGLPIETLANTIVNKFYGSQLFSDNASGKIQQKWKVGMQVLMFSKSKDRWIRGFVRCLEAEGYVTVAYGDRVKTVHPDSGSIKLADVPDESKSKTAEWRTSEEAKFEVIQTSSQSYIPNEKEGKVKSGDLEEPSVIESMHEYREKQLREIMRVLEKEVESNKNRLASSNASVRPVDSSAFTVETRLRANSCPNEVKSKLVNSLRRIKKPIGIIHENKPINFSTEADQRLVPFDESSNIRIISEVKPLIIVPKDEDNVGSNISISRNEKLNQDTEASLDSRWEAYEGKRYATMSRQDYIAKVLVIGDACAGKTSIIHRYVSKTFSTGRNVTIGIDIATKRVRVGNDALQLVFWDIAGQERFIGLAPTYYRNADAVLIVLDATTETRNLDTTTRWKSEVDDKVFYRNGDPVPVLLFANKWDLIEGEEKLQVFSDALLDNFCRKHSFDGWFRTSAKTGHNISKGMDFLISKILENRHKHENSSGLESRTSDCVIQLSSNKPNSSKGIRCCGF